jgi:predicted DsbA family dithiol-disulfide isomerase
VTYRPFFLNPDIPQEGYDFIPYMEAKFAGRISLEQAFEGPRRMGEQLGQVFNMEKITKAPNTMLSHCLIALAPEEKQENVIEDVYAAYFEYGEDIGAIETLILIGQQNGMEEGNLREGLINPALHAQIEAEVQHAYKLGISAVPFFVVNNKYGFSGAQPPEVILDFFQQVVEEE